MHAMNKRFGGYAPIVVDVETSGLDALRHGVLEVAAVPLLLDETGRVHTGTTWHAHVELFEGGEVDPEALRLNGIRLDHPFRRAESEDVAMRRFSEAMWQHVKAQRCKRGVLVGHNAHFDLGFMHAAMTRAGVRQPPLHRFTCFDTATLGGVFLGKTVLAEALKRAGLPFDGSQAHSAIYDAEQTATLFCQLMNVLDQDVLAAARTPCSDDDKEA